MSDDDLCPHCPLHFCGVSSAIENLQRTRGVEPSIAATRVEPGRIANGGVQRPSQVALTPCPLNGLLD